MLQFWDGELPRTSTRKVKRKAVVEELKRLDRMAKSASAAKPVDGEKSATQGGIDGWLYPLLAEVSQRPVADIQPTSLLTNDLGFDSLMLTELSVALEGAGVPLTAVEDLTKLQTVEDLKRVIASTGKRNLTAEQKQTVKLADAESDEKDTEIPVPEPVANLGRQLLSFGQKVLYGGVFDLKVTGKSFIPQNRNFLVVANHTSHLDMGLVKVVLGEQGERLTALAARDYFFSTPLRRAYFENFTNLIPMDRHGSLRESLRLAGEALNQGYNLLIFPEGTRSPNGELLEFKPTLGYLALTYEVDVLPMYLDGTYDALPKGSIFPKNKELNVRIGPVLSYRALRAQVAGHGALGELPPEHRDRRAGGARAPGGPGALAREGRRRGREGRAGDASRSPAVTTTKATSR